MNSSRGRGGNGCVTRMARYHRGLEINSLLPMSWRLPTVALALCALLAPVSAAPAQGGGVALVLSGGGARGVAHLGVLKVLEEMHIPVDCVVGTSMGAIVGAGYAVGLSVAEMEKRVRSADWEAMFANSVPRERQPFRDKQDAVRNRSAIVMGYGNGRVLLPQSAVSGQVLDRFLQGLAGQSEVMSSFDLLALPFRAVATDLETGAMVVLDKGPLWRAMRASMAVPGVFLPIEDDGRLLVDGGLVQNLPVDVGRSLCGDRVIAINLGTPPSRRDRLTSATEIVLQAINLALEQNVNQQLERLGERDALVQVELGDITSMDFDRVLDTIPMGERAAREAAASLAAFSVDQQTFGRWQAQRLARWRRPAPIIDSVTVSGLRYVPSESISAGLSGHIGKPLDTAALEEEIDELYSRGDLERLRYSLVREGNRGGLRIEAADKTWGPNFLRFGGGLFADFEGSGAVGLYAGFSRRWLNDWGGRLNVDLQIGTTNRLRGELYQPLGLGASWFVAPTAQVSNRAVPVYVGGKKLSDYKVREFEAGIDLGYEVGAWGEVRLGVRKGSTRTEVLSGLDLYPALDLDTGWLRLSGAIDKLDSPFFPRSGYAANFLLERHSGNYGSDLDYLFSELAAETAVSRGRHSLLFQFSASGSPDRDLPPVARTLLGGPLRLSGYRYGEVWADQTVYARSAYYRRMTKLPEALGRGVYIGADYEWAKLKAYASSGADEGVRRSVSLFVGADTVLGPLYLGAGYSPEADVVRYYLLFGQPY